MCFMCWKWNTYTKKRMLATAFCNINNSENSWKNPWKSHNMPSVNSRQPANIYCESLMPMRPNKSKCVAEQKDLMLSPRSSSASNEGNAFLSNILIWFTVLQRIAGIFSLQGYIWCTSKGQPNLTDHTDVQSFLKSTGLFGRLFWCSS